MGIPYCKKQSRHKKNKKAHDNAQVSPFPDDEKNQDHSVTEEELEFEQYNGTFSDYDELVVQFGFVVLFVVAFPLVPFLAFISCILEFKIDGKKMVELTRRPQPKGIY